MTTMVGAASGDLAAFMPAHSWLAVLAAQPALVTIPISFAVMVGISLAQPRLPDGVAANMLQLHVPDRLGLRRDYIRE